MYYLGEFISRTFSCAYCFRDSFAPQSSFLARGNHFPQQTLKIPNLCFPKFLWSRGMWRSPGQWELRGSLIKEGHLFLLDIFYILLKQRCVKRIWGEKRSAILWPQDDGSEEQLVQSVLQTPHSLESSCIHVKRPWK